MVHTQQAHLERLVLLPTDQQLARGRTHAGHQGLASRLSQPELQLFAGARCAEHPLQRQLWIVKSERAIVGGNIRAAEELVQRRCSHSAPLEAIRRLAEVDDRKRVGRVAEDTERQRGARHAASAARTVTALLQHPLSSQAVAPERLHSVSDR